MAPSCSLSCTMLPAIGAIWCDLCRPRSAPDWWPTAASRGLARPAGSWPSCRSSHRGRRRRIGSCSTPSGRARPLPRPSGARSRSICLSRPGGSAPSPCSRSPSRRSRGRSPGGWSPLAEGSRMAPSSPRPTSPRSPAALPPPRSSTWMPWCARIQYGTAGPCPASPRTTRSSSTPLSFPRSTLSCRPVVSLTPLAASSRMPSLTCVSPSRRGPVRPRPSLSPGAGRRARSRVRRLPSPPRSPS